MRTLKELKLWKIILGIFIGIALISVAVYLFFSALERKELRDFYNVLEDAKNAGYEDTYFVCSKGDEMTFDGEKYIEYQTKVDSFVDGSYYDELLIKSDASYMDETNGATTGLIIYGKLEGYVNDPEDEIMYDPGKYKLIAPYKIAIYTEPIDMWAVSGILVLVGIFELVLAVVLALYFMIYFIRRARAQKHE